MKHLLKVFVVIFLLTGNYCSAQKMVQTISDVQKIEINKEKFIGKPLKNLLKEIAPQIKVYLLKPGSTPGAGTTEEVGNISFAFVETTEYFDKVSKGHRPVTILVYLKEKLVDKASNKSKETKYNWTEEDEKKYENYTVAALRVYGS
jgi:hypothetical protein